MLGAISWEFDCTPIPQLVVKILKESAKLFGRICFFCYIALSILSPRVRLKERAVALWWGISIHPGVVLRHWIVSLHKRVFPEWQEVEVERDIKVQGKVLMKMIIPKQDKVKRLLLLQLNTQVPEEEQKWIQATLSKQKNQELGTISIMQPLQSVQMPIIKYQEFLCSLLTVMPNLNLMLHRHWRINNLRIQRANNYFCNVLHPFGTETYVFC